MWMAPSNYQNGIVGDSSQFNISAGWLNEGGFIYIVNPYWAI